MSSADRCPHRHETAAPGCCWRRLHSGVDVLERPPSPKPPAETGEARRKRERERSRQYRRRGSAGELRWWTTIDHHVVELLVGEQFLQEANLGDLREIFAALETALRVWSRYE